MANLPLLDPFTTLLDYPDTLLTSIRSGHSTCTRFSPDGQYLASGRLDGVVVVFDVDTRSVARRMRGHVGQVQSVSWSVDGRWLVSAGGVDWGVVRWDLADEKYALEKGGDNGEEEEEEQIKMGGENRIQLGKVAFGVEICPSDPRWAVATCFESPPVLIDMTPGKTKQYNLPQAPKRSDAEIAEMTEKQLAAGAKIQTTAAIFTHDGQHILTGTNKGYINIIRVFDRAMLYSTKISSSAILSLRLSSSGRSLVLNSGDRIIRTLLLPELKADTDTDKIHLTPSHKFSDVVNRLSWNHVCFSPSPTSYVLASTYNNHDVYIWERSKGSLVRILEGPKEECGSVEWCEGRVLVAASGLESGRIHLWGVVLPQRWSALAPDFGELEENVEYEEGEDEFDYVPEEEERRRVLEREDEDVDVLSGGKGVNENGWRFKVLLERDLGEESDDEFVMVGAGTMRRKSPGAGQMKTEGEAEGTPGSGTETETGSGVDKKRKGGRGRKR